MPKEAFGGDDSDGGGDAGKKRGGLSRFGLSPDVNIRDVFWRVMDSYADTGKPGTTLAGLENDRFSLMRAALSVLSGPQTGQYSPTQVAEFTIMMLADGGWADALASFLVEAAETNAMRKEVSKAIRKLSHAEGYGSAIRESCSAMLRDRQKSSVAVSYIADSEDAELAVSVRKELMIIARGGIGDEQMNAIRAITLIKDDAEVKKALVVLLSHWDAQARLAAAEALEAMAGDSEVKAAAAKRLQAESDPKIKAILARIAG